MLSTLRTQGSSWASLPLNILGRINLIKIMMLPKFYYLFRNCLIWVPISFFKDIDYCVGSFIWNEAVPRLPKSTLWLPAHLGIFALPNLQMYYWAAMLVSIQWWFIGSKSNVVTCLEAVCLGSLADLWNFAYRGPWVYAVVPGPTTKTKRIVRTVLNTAPS